MNAFAAAVAVLFRDPNMGRDALWRAAGDGPAKLVRVIRRAPDRDVTWGETRAVVDSVALQLLVAQVPDLRGGDTVETGGEVFRIRGEPERDAQRLIWSVEAVAL